MGVSMEVVKRGEKEQLPHETAHLYLASTMYPLDQVIR